MNKDCISTLDMENADWLSTDINGKPVVNTHKLYMNIKEKAQIRITERGNYFIFDGKVYRNISERDLKAIIKSCIPVENRKKKDWTAVYDEYQTDFPDTMEDDFNADENIICFNNGVLKLDTMELTKHSDKYLVTRMVPCDYLEDKTLDDAPVFKKYLYQLVDKDPALITFLMEYM